MPNGNGSKACQVRWQDVVRHVCQGHHGGTKKPGERQHHRCACGSVLTVESGPSSDTSGYPVQTSGPAQKDGSRSL